LFIQHYVANTSTISNVYVVVLARTAILHKYSNNLHCRAICGRDQTLQKVNIVFLNRNLDQNMPKMRYFWKKAVKIAAALPVGLRRLGVRPRSHVY